MCGPALGLVGAVVSAAGSIYSGLAQSASYKAQAQGLEYQAQAESEKGSYESARQAEQNARLTGKQVTAIAASGVDLYGSPVDVVADSRREGELDKQAIRHGAQFRANLARYEASVARSNATSAKIGGFIGAAAPLINGMTGLGNPYAVA